MYTKPFTKEDFQWFLWMMGEPIEENIKRIKEVGFS
jgi:hypothetical protein